MKFWLKISLYLCKFYFLINYYYQLQFSTKCILLFTSEFLNWLYRVSITERPHGTEIDCTVCRVSHRVSITERLTALKLILRSWRASMEYIYCMSRRRNIQQGFLSGGESILHVDLRISWTIQNCEYIVNLKPLQLFYFCIVFFFFFCNLFIVF